MAGLLEAASNRKRKQQLESLPSTSKPRVSAGPSATFKEVKALSFASRLIPERTPNRWKLISTLVEDFTHDDVNTDSLQVQLFEKKLSSFSHSSAECKQISDVLCSKYPGTLGHSDEHFSKILSNYPERIALKHIILIPPVKECCTEPIIIRSKPSFPLVYTTQGTRVAAVFSGECRRRCSKKFHYSYYKVGNATHYYIPQAGEKYFQSSSHTIFEIDLLHDFTQNISISATSFESRAEVYNEKFRDSDLSRLKHLKEYGRTESDSDHPWKLTEQRVEDAWFLFSLVNFYQEKNQLNSINFTATTQPSQRKDIDTLCGNAWEQISRCTNPWIHHQCHKLGCSEGIYIY